MKTGSIVFRSRTGVALLTAVALVVSGCQAAQPTAAPTPGATGPAASPAPADPLAGRTVRWALPSAPDFGNATIPLMQVAFEARGATLEATSFNTQAEANNALLTGQADFQQTQINSIVVAHNVGTDFQALIDVKANEWSLVTPVSITDPGQLDGMRVGIHGPATLTELLVQSTISTSGITPEVLVVPGSEARAAALQAGELDATPADIATVLAIEEAAPGEFHVLIDYNEELPFLGSVIATRQQLIDEDPEYVQAAIDVIVEVQLGVGEDPSPLEEAAAEYLPDLPAEDIPARIEAYAARAYWDPVLTTEQVQAAIQFMIDTGAVTEEDAPPPEDISDLSFLENALEMAGQ